MNALIPTPEDAARFWSWVSIGFSGECWWWNGAMDERGVGQFWIQNRVIRAPQLAWSLANGQPFPSELKACHHCDNPPCCNPAHIWPDTHQANMDDMHEKGRHPHGVTHGGAKITEQDVRDIRAACAAGIQTQEEIGAPYGLSKWQISNIARRLQWGHVPD